MQNDNIKTILDMIETEYNKTDDTIEKYNVLDVIEKKLVELRSNTVENLK